MFPHKPFSVGSRRNASGRPGLVFNLGNFTCCLKFWMELNELNWTLMCSFVTLDSLSYPVPSSTSLHWLVHKIQFGDRSIITVTIVYDTIGNTEKIHSTTTQWRSLSNCCLKWTEYFHYSFLEQKNQTWLVNKVKKKPCGMKTWKIWSEKNWQTKWGANSLCCSVLTYLLWKWAHGKPMWPLFIAIIVFRKAHFSFILSSFLGCSFVPSVLITTCALLPNRNNLPWYILVATLQLHGAIEKPRKSGTASQWQSHLPVDQ